MTGSDGEAAGSPEPEGSPAAASAEPAGADAAAGEATDGGSAEPTEPGATASEAATADGESADATDSDATDSDATEPESELASHGNPWIFFALVAAAPLILVLALVGFSALPPYTPSQAQAQPVASLSDGTGSSASPGASGSPRPGASRSGAATVRVYEAENRAYTTSGPSTRVRAAATASGGKVVTRVGHGTPGGDVTFYGVVANTRGRYTVTIYYLIADKTTHKLAMTVNGRPPVILTFLPAKAPTIVGWVRTTVMLTAGANTVRFSNALGYGPDLDRIVVSPA